MKIAIACDHAGFPLKESVLEVVRNAGHTPLDLGTDSTKPVDYPDYAEKVGRHHPIGAGRARHFAVRLRSGGVHRCQ